MYQDSSQSYAHLKTKLGYTIKMSLSIGIVGLPNVGKSTLFRALTRQRVLIANYPFATIEPNTGIVAVPDERLTALAEEFKPAKVTPATVEFIDIAGLVAGAHKGEGLGNKFLAHIREADAICMVVRAFSDPNVQHISATIDAERDIDTIKTELILADLETLTGALGRLQKQAKAEPKLRTQVNYFSKLKVALDNGSFLSESDLLAEAPPESETTQLINNLLSAKPLIYTFNIDEAKVTDHPFQTSLASLAAGRPCVFISAKLEAELADLAQGEAAQLLATTGLAHSGLEELVQTGYQTLGLITFFTAGEPEVRAWTIHRGDKAPDAAGVIHTDFKRGFIAAEVVTSKTLLAESSWQNAKAKGLVRSEGKDYLMQDGDVCLFRFNA